MKKQTIITLLLLMISISAHAYIGYGVGIKSCGSWLEQRKKGDFYTMAQWVMGYVTAYGYYGEKDLREVDSGAILTFMDNYCQKEPLERIEYGAQALINALKNK